MKKILLASCLLLVGCSQKTAVKLNSHEEALINKSVLLDTHYNNVPLDKSFKKQRYSYIITTSKNKNTYFHNDILVKSFYLLHHANLIVITAKKRIATDYMLYLYNQGISASIQINNANIRSNKVIIDTIHYSPIDKDKYK